MVENGVFTDLINTNVMDEKPFLTIDFTKANPEDLTQLAEFKHDNFHAEKLRFLLKRINIFSNSKP